jgi:sugar O-acyltransferase (sialic acid O-acetyltransferase NeuD family)
LSYEFNQGETLSANFEDEPKKKLVIFGLEDFSEIAFEYFTYDSNYEVVAFTVHERYKIADSKNGIPVISFENISQILEPLDYHIFVAVTYQDMNRIRQNILKESKVLGFTPASYISSRAFIWPNAKIGEHVFIFEDNTIQPFTTIEDNVVLWSGNHIGHHSTICENAFITSHVVISGWVKVGINSFIGVNSTIANGVSIGKYNWINSNSHITQNTAGELFFTEPQTEGKVLNIPALNRALARKSNLRES